MDKNRCNSSPVGQVQVFPSLHLIFSFFPLPLILFFFLHLSICSESSFSNTQHIHFLSHAPTHYPCSLLSSHPDCSLLAHAPALLTVFSLSLSLAGSRLQDGLKLSSHADILLFLTHDTLDGRRQAPGVPGEDEGVAIFAAAILFQGAAGVGDGVVVVVGVDYPVVVAWLAGKGDVRMKRNEGGYKRDVRGICVHS